MLFLTKGFGMTPRFQLLLDTIDMISFSFTLKRKDKSNLALV